MMFISYVIFCIVKDLFVCLFVYFFLFFLSKFVMVVSLYGLI